MDIASQAHTSSNHNEHPDRISILSELSTEWAKLFQGYSSFNKPMLETFRCICDAYERRYRKYHTISHIYHFMTQLREILPQLENPRAALFAMFFHDVKYVPGARDNEQRSAKVAEKTLKALGSPDEEVAQVLELILSGDGHKPIPGNPDSYYFNDCDLAIFASDWKTYKQYAKKIRAEYRIIDTQTYANRRIEILEKFLAREKLFHVHPALVAREQAARDNLQKEIRLLKRMLKKPPHSCSYSRTNSSWRK